MPNHMSAKLLLEYAQGMAPDKLSAGGSFHEIDSRASGIITRIGMITRSGKFSGGKATRDEAAEALAELQEIEDKVDERGEQTDGCREMMGAWTLWTHSCF